MCMLLLMRIAIIGLRLFIASLKLLGPSPSISQWLLMYPRLLCMTRLHGLVMNPIPILNILKDFKNTPPANLLSKIIFQLYEK